MTAAPRPIVAPGAANVGAARVAPVGAMVATPEDALRLGSAHVGGKAHALARLTAAAEHVPQWLVIPADVFEMHLTMTGATERVQRELTVLARAADDSRAVAGAAAILQQIVDDLTIDPMLLRALADSATTLGGGPFAVRSSAVGEDGERLSFAGQFETVLGVSAQADEMAAAVRRCWRSAFSARVLDYRHRSGTLAEAARLGVIVQRLIAGDVSGVLFTLDPVTGDGGRMRVSACAGLGEQLVSGEVDGDEYVIVRDGREVDADAIGGNCDVPAARTLDSTALLALAQLGRRIEEREGGPRDIEWTMLGGDLWVLQSRPITSSPAAAGSAAQHEEHRIVWDNSNIQESYCGVTTPLTFSFARTAYSSVYEQTLRAVGVSETTIAAHRPMLNNLLGLIQGRVYYNLNNWYRGLLLLPSFGRNKADMERMMGVEEPVDFVPDEAPNIIERLRRVPALVRTLAGFKRAFATLDRDADVFLREFDARIRELDRGSLHHRSLGELMTILAQLRSECIERWVTPIINDFRVMMATGRLRRLVERALPGDSARVMQTLLGGADVTASAEPAMLVLRLAETARENPAVIRALRDLPPAGALATARRESPAFARTLDELLQRYGDRCMGELKLESRSLHEDPTFVVRMLRNYIDGRMPDSAKLADAARRSREEAERNVASRLGILARARFRRALALARRGIRARESMRLARTRLFGTHRDIYRAIGARMCAAGRLQAAEDVLYLTTHEIEELWDGTGASADLAAIVRARRGEFAAYELETPPNRIITTGVPHSVVSSAARANALAPNVGIEYQSRIGSAASAGTTEKRMLRGLGCSAGVSEGIVRVVRSASDDLELDGHILVAPRTDPGWAPLFPCARAIIVERGSLLSHSAVLARELGIPAVVGIPGVVDTLRDGERVRVDGCAGTIERLDVP